MRQVGRFAAQPASEIAGQVRRTAVSRLAAPLQLPQPERATGRHLGPAFATARFEPAGNRMPQPPLYAIDGFGPPANAET